MSARDQLIASAYLLGYVVPSVAVAVRLACRYSDDGLDRTFVGALLGIAQAVGLPLLAMMLGILDRNTVLAFHLALAAGVLLFVPRRATAEDRARPGLSFGSIVAVGAVAGFVALSGLLALAGPTKDFDSRNYHLPHVADWIQGRSLWRFPFQLPGAWTAAHPSNGDVLGLWLALPTHGDQLSLLAPTLFALLGILAAAVLARELGGKAWVGALAGTAVFSTPILYWSQTRTLATDNAAGACIIAAAALIACAVKRHEWRWAAAAGVALGLGMGSKYTALVPGAALALAAVVPLRRGGRWIWLLPGLLFFFAPWLIRNWVETGNPLFPQGIKVAGVRVFATSQRPISAFSTPVAHFFLHGQWSVLRRWGGHVAFWVGPVALMAAIGVVAGFRKRAARLGRALSIVAIVAGIGYLITPFTGGGPQGTIGWLLYNIRYAEAALLLGAALAAGVVGGVPFQALALVSLAYNAARIVQETSLARLNGLGVSFRTASIAVAVAALAVAVAAWRRAGVRLPSPRATAALAIVPIVLAWGGAGLLLHRIDAGYRPTELEALVLRARGPDRTVAVIGVRDLRSVTGRSLDTRLTSPAISLDAPLGDAAMLDAAVLASDPRVLVVSLQPAFGVPRGYRPPPQWCVVGGVGTEFVFVRRSPPATSGRETVLRALPCG